MNEPDFTLKLFLWYDSFKRDLPWRNTKNPYFIWLSEIILQQTRVNQGLSYYVRFTDSFPTIFDLASATEDEVMKLWQGLGYYSRARNMHAAAKQIVDNFGGEFPTNYYDIKSLRGVGKYTAAAIASFAFDQPHVVVDGNVIRFISRLYAIESPVDSAKVKTLIQSLADGLLDKRNPGKFNQAIMEFGALVCKPGRPDCFSCVFQASCQAFKNKMTAVIPIKSPKKKVEKRYFHFIFFEDNAGKTLIMKRNLNDIWRGLYQFPMKETFSCEDFKPDFTFDFDIIHVSEVIIHQLTHQMIHAKVWHLKVKTLPKRYFPGTLPVEITAIMDFAFPRLLSRYIDNRQI